MYVLTDSFNLYLENSKYHRCNLNFILIFIHSVTLGPFCSILFSYICLLPLLMAGTDFCGLLSDSVPHIQNRSARQKQTENTHILGKKLQRPPVSPYWWNARWSGSIMKNVSIASFISYEKWWYPDIPQNKSIYQLFHNSTEFLCKTDR